MGLRNRYHILSYEVAEGGTFNDSLKFTNVYLKYTYVLSQRETFSNVN